MVLAQHSQRSACRTAGGAGTPGGQQGPGQRADRAERDDHAAAQPRPTHVGSDSRGHEDHGAERRSSRHTVSPAPQLVGRYDRARQTERRWPVRLPITALTPPPAARERAATALRGPTPPGRRRPGAAQVADPQQAAVLDGVGERATGQHADQQGANHDAAVRPGLHGGPALPQHQQRQGDNSRKSPLPRRPAGDPRAVLAGDEPFTGSPRRDEAGRGTDDGDAPPPAGLSVAFAPSGADHADAVQPGFLVGVEALQV